MRNSLRNILAVVLVMCACLSATERQPNSAYRARREALAAKTKGVVLLLAPTEASAGDAIYGFRQDENFYYLTGIPDPGAALLISAPVEASGNRPARPYTEILFLPPQNEQQEKWTGPKLNPNTKDVTQVTGFDKVMSVESMRTEIMRAAQGNVTIFTDLTPPAGRTELDFLKRSNGAVSSIRPYWGQLRVIKDAGEIDLIKKATDASTAGHFAVMKIMKPGLTEREVAALHQYEFSRRGCERPAYAPIVGAGFWGTVLHYSENSNTIADGDVVVMDVAGEYSMYASDITRTLPANGKFTARQREIYEIVLAAQKAAEDAFKSGVSTMRGPNGLHEVAAKYIDTHGKDLKGGSLGQYFIHGLGHGVGLNVHDPGDGQAFKPGSVFTLEPGIYLPEEKLGVRIEDMYWVNPEGKLVKLSANLPSTVEEIEKIMAEAKAPAAAPARGKKK
ncbi:MAG TPA: Xaa-Pro peptidase family protein [Terriglobales bacterium]|nr:Xaa-Pro peptidase family protein [Terriglobales bacterium]